MSLADAACGGIELALNRYLALDPTAQAKIAALHGRVLGIEVLGLGLRLYLVPGPTGIQVLRRYEGEPDCTLRGTPLALAQMSSAPGGVELLFSKSVEIKGNTELGQTFGTILQRLDIDWEEQLSRVTGDAIAHRIGGGIRGLSRWGKQALDNLGMDLQEYLQEELRLLPTRCEIEVFLGDVDMLRDDVERLQARADRLQRQIRPNPETGQAQ